MKHIKNPLFILLALCMIAGLLPWTALPALAQAGTAEAAQGAAHAAYTVEFTYEGRQYVMTGDSSVRLSEILEAVGLTGEAEAVAVSDASLFFASNATGEWIVTSHQAFDTDEWMKVTIGGVVYEITVTDTQSPYGHQGSGTAEPKTHGRSPLHSNGSISHKVWSTPITPPTATSITSSPPTSR